jgi:hypothetical protein
MHTALSFIEGVAILSNAPERLPEKKRPERGDRERSRGHGSGGTNPGSHGNARQVSDEMCITLAFFVNIIFSDPKHI